MVGGQKYISATPAAAATIIYETFLFICSLWCSPSFALIACFAQNFFAMVSNGVERTMRNVIKLKCSQRKFVQRIKCHSETLRSTRSCRNSNRQMGEKKVYRWQFKRNWCLKRTSIELFGQDVAQTHTHRKCERASEQASEWAFHLMHTNVREGRKYKTHTYKRISSRSKFSCCLRKLQIYVVQNFSKLNAFYFFAVDFSGICLTV